MEKDSKILIAGASGLVGSALVEELRAQGYTNLLTTGRPDLDFTSAEQTSWYFSAFQPEYVFFCAARVGGIVDNAANKVEFLVKNLHMELNATTAAAKHQCKKFLFVGTSCVFPKDAPQPILEEDLLCGPLEPATEAYSIAKIAGLKLCQYYKESGKLNAVTALPCNVFGPRDRFDPETSHCLPGLIARLYTAKMAGERQFELWGSGEARREFIYSEDLARALIYVMRHYEGIGPINAGSDFELTIIQLTTILARAIGYNGQIISNVHRPVGTMRKLLDSSKLRALGWRPEIPFIEGVRRTYEYFLSKR